MGGAVVGVYGGGRSSRSVDMMVVLGHKTRASLAWSLAQMALLTTTAT